MVTAILCALFSVCSALPCGAVDLGQRHERADDYCFGGGAAECFSVGSDLTKIVFMPITAKKTANNLEICALGKKAARSAPASAAGMPPKTAGLMGAEQSRLFL